MTRKPIISKAIPTLHRPTQANMLAPVRPNSAQEYNQCMRMHRYLKDLQGHVAAVELAPSVIRILWNSQHCDKYYDRSSIRQRVRAELGDGVIKRLLEHGDNPVDICMAENTIGAMNAL